ncbi:hypothetical protein LPB140_11975 [Sphingorhabdus lutea]|uniref:Metal-dependent hydrolase n=2 Tax=Sphingorhabdus lutea TaxID=1913578 RepID=A0A1L3JE39_9SPHN|nr:hypothetical protein LPB140_11975 [Sphingorhabdus lutea]
MVGYENINITETDNGSIANNLGDAISTQRHIVASARPFHINKSHQINGQYMKSGIYADAFFYDLSAIFPKGEAFMIKTMAWWRDKMPADQLPDIANFIEQEAGHSREHIAMNKLIQNAGFNLSNSDKNVESVVKRAAALSPRGRLLAVVCLEHMTAIMAAEMIKNPQHVENFSAEFRDFWLWHAVEEVDHKSVVFDAWRYSVRDKSETWQYLTRCSMMLLISISFVINRTRGQLSLLKQHDIGKIKGFFGMMRYGLRKGGLARNILPHWKLFFHRGFHPSQINDRHLLEKGEKLIAASLQTKSFNKAKPKNRAKKPVKIFAAKAA